MKKECVMHSTENWKCTSCEQRCDPTDSSWRWAGDKWQHQHPYPNGYFDARFVAQIPQPQVTQCPKCSSTPIPIAHDTGDGWFLGWECLNGCEPKEWEDGMVGFWPREQETISASELQELGFKIV